MKYTVKQLAGLAGISVRTLHYYDSINLLKPSYKAQNGYRYYEEKELLKLQQILFFTELEFPLKEIAGIMDSPDYKTGAALKEQKKLLQLKKERIENHIKTIDKTLKSGKGGGKTVNNDTLFASFKDEKLKEYMAEAKKKWGNTDAYRQSMEKVKHWTKADYERIKKEGNEFTRKLADAMDKDIKDPYVQSLVQKHHQGIEYFYTCPYGMYKSLADMYVNDRRFTAYYDKFRPGLAQWLRDAIHYYCDQHQHRKQ